MALLNTGTAVYIGDVPAVAVYQGDIQVWPPPDPPTNFAGIANSISQTTLTWVDSTHPSITLYDVYYNLTGAPVTDLDTPVAVNITAGIQQAVHTLDSNAQGALNVFYGVLGKSA